MGFLENLDNNQNEGSTQSDSYQGVLLPQTIGEYFDQQSDPNNVPSVEAYQGAYTNEVPQNVIESQQPFAEVNIATPEYAKEMQNRIISDWNSYQTDDNYQGMLNKTYTEQTYDYLKRKNKGADPSAWTEPNPEDDLFSSWLPQWIIQQDEERKIQEKLRQETPSDEQKLVKGVQNQMTTQAQRELMNANQIEHGNWNLLSWWDKAKYLLIPGSSATKMDDAPDWAKYIQNIFPSVMAGGGGALVGSVFGPVGSAIGGIATGALTYLQGVTDVKIPVLNEMLEAMDILSVWTEQGQGAVGAALSQAKRELGEGAGLLDLLHTAADVLKENPYLFEVAKYSYEASADLGFDDIALFIRNTGAKISDELFGTNIGQRDISQVSRANIGRSDLENVVEGTQGYQALYDTYLPIFEGLINAAVQTGLTEQEAIEFAHQNLEQYVLNYYGSTGLTRDLVTSSVADPANLIPYVSAKLTQGVGKVTGNTALENAGRAAVGNPIIDLLPPGVQTLAETALSPLDGKKIGNKTINVHGSQGFDTISAAYKDNLRSTMDVSSLSSWQKRFAGIDDSGKINDYNVWTPRNVIEKYTVGLFKQTEDSKMLDLTQMSTDFLGNVLFNKDTLLYNVPDLIEQVLGTKPIDDNSPLASFRNTATLNTLQEAFSNVGEGTIESIRRDVLNYRKFADSRAVLNHVAEQLGMSVDDIFKALDNEVTVNRADPKYQGMERKQKLRAFDADRQRLIKQINDAGITFTDATGKTLSTNQVIKKIDIFRTKDADGQTIKNHPGRKQYSETYLKASMMDNIATQIDDYNLRKFNITPDSWATRTSNLMKSMQSIALLNFSTSYHVNNFLNNIITRSVTGVGGASTDFVNTVNAKRGLFLSRNEKDASGNKSIYQRTSEAIGKRKKANDILQKFDDLYSKGSKDIKILNGLKFGDIEGMEKNAAFNIGTNRYWMATWANNIPEIPAAWKALGITNDMNQQIFKIALDSPSMTEFRKNIMGEVILPKAMSTLDQMLANEYSTNDAKIIRDFISSKPWITDHVDSFMETGDPRLIKRGFEQLIDKLTNDVEVQNIVQLAGAFEDYRNTFSGEGIGSAANALEALNDLYTQMWMHQTRENGTLFLDRITRAISDPDFDTMYETVTKLQTNDYHIARGYTIMAIGGMLEGMGIDSDTGLSLLSNAMAFYDLGEEYIKTRHEMHKKYARRDSKDFDYKKWHDDSISACTELLNKQLDATKAMHKTYVDYLRNNLDDTYTGRIDAFEKALDEVVKLKEEDVRLEIKDLKNRLPQPNKRARETESLHQEKPRLNRKSQIHDAYQYAAIKLKEMEGAMPANQSKTGTMSLENTLKLMMLHNEAQSMANFSGEFLKKYKDGAKPETVYKPVDFSNKIINGESFSQYGAKRIISEAQKAGVDPQTEYARSVITYYKGDGVPLGFADAVHDSHAIYSDTGSAGKMPVGTQFELINPNADLKVNAYTVARSKPFAWGNDVANAGVYHNGNLIGYITSGMKETVTVDGKTYPVIGISAKDPNTYLVYIKNRVWEVTPGKPTGIEYTIFAKENFHPQMPGTMPTIEATGKAALETSVGMREAVRRWQAQALSDLSKAQDNGSIFGKMTDAQKQAVYEWMNTDLNQAYNSQRFQTQRYGETMVDAALLNYNKRYGFDNLLTAIMPYQFWMTRSMMNWGKRMISQPAWFSMYARLEKLIEKNKKDFLPSRLEGTVGLLAPSMGDGMGSAWFIDPFSTILPFSQFYNVADYYISNLNTIHQNTLTKIDEMYEKGELFNGKPITEEMYDEATNYGRGELYEAIFKQIQATDESDTSLGGLMGTFFGPPVWFDMARKHLEGKDKSISYSPMYRMGNLVKAVGDETPLESITNVIASGLQLPENTIRKLAGIESNPDGNYADYGIVSNIANMLTENRISYNDAINAIAEGPGNRIYEQALYQYRQQQAVRMQGGALATEISQSISGNKSTSLGQLASSALASIFGAKVLPEGEETYRHNQDNYRAIKLTGDKELKSEFWDNHPDQQVHYYSYEDDPEKRLHRVLVDNMSNAFYALPYTQQNAVAEALGPRFQTLFRNKETRATDLLDIDDILTWTKAMHGNVPELPDSMITGPAQQLQQVQWYSNSVQSDYDRYQRDKKHKFPGIDTVEDGYYNTPQNMKDQYLQKNPMLQKYWDWNKGVKNANPRLAVFLNDRSAQYKVDQGQYADITDAIMGSINDWTKSQLENHIKYGWTMKPDAERTLRVAYTSLRTNVPYDTWLKSLVK